MSIPIDVFTFPPPDVDVMGLARVHVRGDTLTLTYGWEYDFSAPEVHVYVR